MVSLRFWARKPPVPSVQGTGTTSVARYGSAKAALAGCDSVDGALAAMTQFGHDRGVALAALRTTTHAAARVPQSLARSSEFWVEAFRSNPLLAMPETQPPFLRKALVAKPTTEAERGVQAVVTKLRAAIERRGTAELTSHHNLPSLQQAVDAGGWLARFRRG